MLFRARQFEFLFPRPVLVMGIVNVTPDSFSDGGTFFDPAAAVARALELIKQGAEILDVGGESTRPGAAPVNEKEELRRVIPVIEQLAGKIKVPISVDTMKPAVARAALQAGAAIVNDVAAATRSAAGRGFRAPDAMWGVVSEFRAGYVCMHAPRATLHQINQDLDIVADVDQFFRDDLDQLKAAGVPAEQIIFDPGIGFGKTLEQNLELLANLRRFAKLERPLLLGVSRKSFIEKLFAATVNERLPASLACATLAVESDVRIIRAHDVAETVQAARMAEAIFARRNDLD